MEQQEAREYLRLIGETLEASNRALLSGLYLFVCGIIILFVPLLEYFTQYMTFGYTFSVNIDYNDAVIAAIHIVVYVLLFNIVDLLIKGLFTRQKREVAHPLIRKALNIEYPIIFAILGAVILLNVVDQGQLAFPIAYLFLGIMFNLFGRFTTKLIMFFSWSYIVFGLFYIYLSKYSIPYLWMIYTFYLGGSYLIMGLKLLKLKATK